MSHQTVGVPLPTFLPVFTSSKVSTPHHGLPQQRFQVVDQGKARAAPHPELQNARILAGRAVQLPGQRLVAEHGIVDDLRQRVVLRPAQFLQLRGHVVREPLPGEADELRHRVGHSLHLRVVCHGVSSSFAGIRSVLSITPS